MKKYMILFVGGNAPQDQESNMKQWMDWVGALAKDGKWESGAPLGHGKRITDVAMHAVDYEGMDENAISGYGVLLAQDVDEALALVKGCPALQDGGMVELREVMDM